MLIPIFLRTLTFIESGQVSAIIYSNQRRPTFICLFNLLKLCDVFGNNMLRKFMRIFLSFLSRKCNSICFQAYLNRNQILLNQSSFSILKHLIKPLQQKKKHYTLDVHSKYALLDREQFFFYFNEQIKSKNKPP